MNEINDETPQDEQAAENPNFLDQPDGHDWLLAWLIGHAEAYGLEFGITLSVSGLTVTGILINGRKYFEQLRKDMLSATGTTKSLTETLANSFTFWEDIYPKDPSEINIHELKPNYIHLKDAKVFLENARPLPQNGLLWRGKISSVDGFSVGMITAS